MSVWELCDDTGLKALYLSIPAQILSKERWFADRELLSEIELVDSVQFHQTGLNDPIIAFNLYKTQSCADYYYFLPFLITNEPDPKRSVLFEKSSYFFYDAVPTDGYVSLLEELVLSQKSVPTAKGNYRFQSNHAALKPVLRLHGGSSNSLLFVSRNYLVKNYRRIYPGINPELKISSALTEIGSQQIPEVYGFFGYTDQNDNTLGIIMEAVENTGTGWERWGRILKQDSPETEESLCKEAGLLGSALGLLHSDLARVARKYGEYSELKNIDFEGRTDQLVNDIKSGLNDLCDVEYIASKLNDLKNRFTGRYLGAKFRIHGDLHLEQVIRTGEGWKILDFEGEPLKSIPERENFDSPLKDLASMLRSLSYRLNGGEGRSSEIEGKLGSRLVQGYIQSCREQNADFLPESNEFQILLLFFQIERAVYECFYESKYRPDWLWIPRTGLMNLVGSL